MLPEEVVVSNSFDGPPVKKRISEIEDNEIIFSQLMNKNDEYSYELESNYSCLLYTSDAADE